MVQIRQGKLNFTTMSDIPEGASLLTGTFSGQLGMNSTRGSTPPNPNFDLLNHSTDLNKTLGIIGTPHEEFIAMILSTKTCQIKRNR
jgi:hypothetical protein